MSGSVVVVFTCVPQGSTGKHIQCAAGRVCRENLRTQGNVRFQNQRKVFGHFPGRNAQGNSAGDVGGAVLILSAAVKQQQRIIIKATVAVTVRMIVDNGAVRAGSGNGGKAFGKIVVAFGAESVQFFNNVQFGFSLSVCVKPAKKFGDGDAVAEVGAADTRKFDRGF